MFKRFKLKKLFCWEIDQKFESLLKFDLTKQFISVKYDQAHPKYILFSL